MIKVSMEVFQFRNREKYSLVLDFFQTIVFRYNNNISEKKLFVILN